MLIGERHTRLQQQVLTDTDLAARPESKSFRLQTACGFN